MVQHNSLKSYTEGVGIKLATPVYLLTDSPPAASTQHHRQDQVIKGTRYLHMWRNCPICSGCLSECNNSFQCHSVIYGFQFWYPYYYLHFKVWNQVWQSWNWWPLCRAEVTIGWKNSSTFPCDLIIRLHHHRRFETHTPLCMNIQDGVKCDKLSPAGPVIDKILKCPATRGKYICGRIIQASLVTFFSPIISMNVLSENSNSVTSKVPRNEFQSYW